MMKTVQKFSHSNMNCIVCNETCQILQRRATALEKHWALMSTYVTPFQTGNAANEVQI